MLDLLLKTLHSEFFDKIQEDTDSTPRAATFPEVDNKILVAIGMRRTGKTYFLLQQVKKLLSANVPLSRILYINFEDERLYPLDYKKLGELLDAFYTLYPENHDHECYLFLDEIQNVTEWPVVIRRFFDTKKVKIYLTGSSAKLLSKEIATSLRGRSLAIEIWPFSFAEFLTAQSVALNKQIMGKQTQDKLMQQLRHYMQQGGFPELIHIPHQDNQITVLQEYVNVVILRDIIERYNITNISVIRYLIKFLLNNAGASCSINKIFNDLKSQGFTVSKTTLYDYIAYIEDAFMAFLVPLYTSSIRQEHSNPRKIYAIDTGLVNAYTLKFNKNLGHLFENMVYLELRRRELEIFYYLTKERYEVDFLTRNKRGELNLYQVVWDQSDKETQEREERALKIAEKELGVKGQIITPEKFITEFSES